jgi:hypothetical protein
MGNIQEIMDIGQLIKDKVRCWALGLCNSIGY